MVRRFLDIARVLTCVLICLGGFAVAAPARETHAGPVLILGDSLSAAHGIGMQEGWVALLERRLAAPPARPVVNASISGETSSGGLARLPKLLEEYKPALVIVELGANDGLRGLPLADIRGNLAEVLKQIRAAGAAVVLLGIELPLNYGPRYRDGLRSMYRGLADEFNVPLLPFLLEGIALDPDLMQADGLHPVAAAEPKVLENVWGVLDPALRKLAR